METVKAGIIHIGGTPDKPVQRLANTLAFERRCIRSSFVAQVRRTLPVRLHLRALLARRIDALDASAICETLHYPPGTLSRAPTSKERGLIAYLFVYASKIIEILRSRIDITGKFQENKRTKT
jgi:hypothetical protein